MTRRLAWAAAAAAATICTPLVACGPAHRSHILPPATANASPPGVYVAIGDSQTRGQGADNPLRQAWPHVVFRSLPSNYTLINLATPGATVASASNEQLPEAQALHPTLVTVWLNAGDLLSGLSAAQYQLQLTALLHGLRATGAKVFVANAPPLDLLPAYTACTDPTSGAGSCPPFLPRPLPDRASLHTAVDSYNAATAAVAAAQGCVLVDLHATTQAEVAQGRQAALISGDGFDPNAAGYQVIADQFIAGLHSAGVVSNA